MSPKIRRACLNKASDLGFIGRTPVLIHPPVTDQIPLVEPSQQQQQQPPPRPEVQQPQPQFEVPSEMNDPIPFTKPRAISV